MIKDENNIERLPAIGVIPYGSWPSFNLSKVSLDELEWPVGRPLRLSTGTVRDLTTEDHILTFPRKPIFLFPRYKVKAKISVMIVL